MLLVRFFIISFFIFSLSCTSDTITNEKEKARTSLDDLAGEIVSDVTEGIITRGANEINERIGVPPNTKLNKPEEKKPDSDKSTSPVLPPWLTSTIDTLEKETNEGNLEASYYMALIYKEYAETNNNQDAFEKALYWIEYGANKEDIKSQYLLGKIYYTGLSPFIEKDLIKSHHWLEKASQKGSEQASEILQNITSEEKEIINKNENELLSN